jgi:hypothetical protein
MLVLVHEQNPSFFSYVRTFPLIEAELGLSWHQDTAFHSSIIQSIINFGYPSVAQHGIPVTIYHVLSHYLDAFIIFITGIEVFDSYGMLFYFKSFLIVSVIIVFVSNVIDDRRPFVFLITLLLISPVILGTWHIIGSHGLWFTSMLLVVSSIKVFNILTKDDKNSLYDLIFLYFLIVFISFGKISTGFMYATFIGFYLLYKEPKDIKIYGLGLLWVVFFFIYQKLMAGPRENMGLMDIDLYSIYMYLTNTSHYSKLILSIYATLFILFFISLLFKSRKNNIAFMAALSSFFILTIVSNIKEFSSPDIFYFKYGFSSILILFTIQSLFFNVKHYHEAKFLKFSNNNIKVAIILLVSPVISLSLYYRQTFDFLDIVEKKQHKYDNRYFLKINNRVNQGDKMSYQKIIKNPFQNHLPENIERPLFEFRKSLFKFMSLNDISKTQALLFVPKEIFEHDIDIFRGEKWARGLFFYAVMGVPLINGVSELRGNYGYADYSSEALWEKNRDFSKHKACDDNPNKIIIRVMNFDNPQFCLYHCYK